MSGDLIPFCHTPSWHGAHEAQGQLYLLCLGVVVAELG